MLKLGELIFRPDPEDPPKSSIKLADLPMAPVEPIAPVVNGLIDLHPTVPLGVDRQERALPVVAPVVDEAAMIVDIDDTGVVANGDTRGQHHH